MIHQSSTSFRFADASLVLAPLSGPSSLSCGVGTVKTHVIFVRGLTAQNNQHNGIRASSVDIAAGLCLPCKVER